MTQAVWVAERAATHSRFVFSNHTQYKFNLISEVMKFYNFEIHGTGLYPIAWALKIVTCV